MYEYSVYGRNASYVFITFFSLSLSPLIYTLVYVFFHFQPVLQLLYTFLNLIVSKKYYVCYRQRITVVSIKINK